MSASTLQGRREPALVPAHGSGMGDQVCFQSPLAWLLGTLCHPKGGCRLQLNQQPWYLSLPAGSLLDFLKSNEGNKLPLPKLIDFSAQVRKEQALSTPCTSKKGE